MWTVFYYLPYTGLCQMSKTKQPAQRDIQLAHQLSSLLSTPPTKNTSLQFWSGMLFLFFLTYATTPYLQIVFNTAAHLILTLWSVDTSMHRALLHRILAALCAIFCSGLLYCIPCSYKQNATTYSPKPLLVKTVLQQFLSALAILVLCGFAAAAIEKLCLRSSIRYIQADIVKLRSTISGLILLFIDTTVLAFKEELIYRAFPGFVLRTYFVTEPTKHTHFSNTSYRYTFGMVLILVLLSIPFGFTHTGIGVVLGSLLAGTIFLYLIAIKNVRWWILALAHTIYNFLVLLTISV